MATWEWTGFDPSGKPITGFSEGDSEDEVHARISASGVVVTQVRPGKNDAAAGKVSVDDIMLFSRQMNTLMKAGVPILKSLTGLAESSKNPAFSAILLDIRNELEQGRELSQAIRKHKTVFGDFYSNMIRVGETAGQLEDIFYQLYKHAEFDKDMKDRIKSAFRYPTFVIVAIAAAMAIILGFVIPSFAKVYAGLNAELPIFTRILIGFSDWFVKLAPLTVALGVFSMWRFRIWKETKEGRFKWHSILLKVPVLGEIFLKSSLARFCKGMALTLRSGLPILQAIDTVASIVGNDVIARKMHETRNIIERGGSLYSAYSGTGVFTPVVMQMISVGEEAGDIPGLLAEVAGMYEREIDIDIKTISARIEPFLLVVLGAMVVVLALGVFLPVWNLSGALMGGGK